MTAKEKALSAKLLEVEKRLRAIQKKKKKEKAALPTEPIYNGLLADDIPGTTTREIHKIGYTVLFLTGSTEKTRDILLEAVNEAVISIHQFAVLIKLAPGLI